MLGVSCSFERAGWSGHVGSRPMEAEEEGTALAGGV